MMASACLAEGLYIVFHAISNVVQNYSSVNIATSAVFWSMLLQVVCA